MNAATLVNAGPCRNCDAALVPASRFRAGCGQRTTPLRLTMVEIAHDFLHVLTHADHSIVALIKGLALHPGFRALVLALVATPAIYFAGVAAANPVFVPLYYGAWLAYIAHAAAQFYRGG